MDKIKLGDDIKITELGNDYQIAGLLFSGQGRSFVVSLPHKVDDINEPITQLQLNEEGVLGLLKQLDTLETEIFTRDSSGITKQIVRKSQRQIDNIMQWEVFKRDNYTCRYCGRTGIPMSVDHIILWEEGGPTTADNLLCTCKSCNRDRGRMQYEAWLKSPMYANKSKNLSQEIKNANMAIALDLPRLRSMTVQNIRSR